MSKICFRTIKALQQHINRNVFLQYIRYRMVKRTHQPSASFSDESYDRLQRTPSLTNIYITLDARRATAFRPLFRSPCRITVTHNSPEGFVSLETAGQGKGVCVSTIIPYWMDNDPFLPGMNTLEKQHSARNKKTYAGVSKM